VVQTLVAHRLEPLLIDVNPKSREYARHQGLHLQLGDAVHEEILMHAGLAGVCMATVLEIYVLMHIEFGIPWKLTTRNSACFKHHSCRCYQD